MVGRENPHQRRCVGALAVRLCGGVSVCLRGGLGGLLRRHISQTAQNPPLQPTQEEAYRCTSTTEQHSIAGDQQPQFPALAGPGCVYCEF